MSPSVPARIRPDNTRFIDCEKWRKEFGGGVDELVKTFEYTERAEVFKYYPQYYHKTDKVSCAVCTIGDRMLTGAGWPLRLH